jgi:DNA-binding NarL/FixJ family response regulator
MTRILIVDDHTLVRDALCRLLESEEDIKVVAQAGSGEEALDLCRQKKPDLVILDYGLPDMDGLETTKELMKQRHKTRVLILTMYENEEYATRLIQAGASGFVVKAAATDELLAAVRKVAADGLYVSRTIMERVVRRIGEPAEDAPEALLSNRELQVLQRLARGSTSREVAEFLDLSLSTVETYRARILEKLDLRNNSDLTRFAIRRGLIDVD